MTEPVWRWVGEAVVLAIHDAQLAEHGGLPGTRDIDLVRSALARPRHLAAYDTTADVAALAASYAYAIARNHGFLGGNKRTAFVVAAVFLLDHGFALTASDRDVIEVMQSVAAGTLAEAELAVWFRREIEPI